MKRDDDHSIETYHTASNDIPYQREKHSKSLEIRVYFNTKMKLQTFWDSFNFSC